MVSLFRNRTEALGPGWLDEHTGQWVEHGLVTSDQVDAIRAFEQHETAEPRFSIVAELAVYLGSVLALMSGAMMVGPNWEALRTAGQMAIGLAIAALGFVAGARLIRLDDGGTRRLASFMWLIGTGGIALTLGAIVDTAAFQSPAWNVVVIGAADLRDRCGVVAQPRSSPPGRDDRSRCRAHARRHRQPRRDHPLGWWDPAVDAGRRDRRPGRRPGASPRDVRDRRRGRRRDDRFRRCWPT